MAEQDSSFNHLPVELKTKIFHKLDAESKKSARLVCNCWHEIIDNGWRPVTFVPELSDANLKYVINSGKHFDNLKVKDLTKGLSISLRRNKLTCDVRTLTLEKNVSSQNIMKLLRYSPNMRKLVLSNLQDEITAIASLIGSCWITIMLTSLDIQFDVVDPSQSLLLAKISIQPFPHLKKLFFTWKPKEDSERNIFVGDSLVTTFYESYLCIHEMIVNCRDTVKSVSTNFYSVFQTEGLDVLINDELLLEKYDKVCLGLKDIALEELEIHAFHQEGAFPWNFSTALMNSDAGYLTDIFLYNCEMLTSNDVQQLIKRNENVLKHFDLVSNYNVHLVVFECSWLSCCHKLTSLGIDCYGNDTHIFKVIKLEEIPKSISTLTMVSEWLPSFQEKLWITENLSQLYYICFNIDRVFTSDLIVEGHALANEEEAVYERALIGNNHLGNENTNDLFPVTLLKKFLSIPQLRYLTLIHSKGFNSQEIIGYCRSHKYLEYNEKVGTVLNRIYITVR